MMGDPNNPFGYSFLTYVWVLILGCIGGAVRYLNQMRGFRVGAFLIDMVSASFTSLITFWLCEAGGISGALQAALIGISGLMGSRAWKEFEIILRSKFGLPPPEYYQEYSHGRTDRRYPDASNGDDPEVRRKHVPSDSHVDDHPSEESPRLTTADQPSLGDERKGVSRS